LIDLFVGTYRLSSHARLEAFVIQTKLAIPERLLFPNHLWGGLTNLQFTLFSTNEAYAQPFTTASKDKHTDEHKVS
jgi:hypothetical protein